MLDAIPIRSAEDRPRSTQVKCRRLAKPRPVAFVSTEKRSGSLARPVLRGGSKNDSRTFTTAGYSNRGESNPRETAIERIDQGVGSPARKKRCPHKPWSQQLTTGGAGELPHTRACEDQCTVTWRFVGAAGEVGTTGAA